MPDLAAALRLRRDAIEARARSSFDGTSLAPASPRTWNGATIGQVEGVQATPPSDPAILAKALAVRDAQVAQRASQLAEFQTWRPTPSPSRPTRA